ncbi:MAG: YlbF family regulator [bacterium]|nr:YlbF family regulator [bacterium]MDY4099282.1 YlbF family regulator [Lachnospiraceae bacterium]
MDERVRDERSDIQTALEQLTAAMKNSEEYVRFKRAEAKVAEFSGLQQRIDEFRKNWYALQSSGAPDLFEQIDQVEENNMDFRENPYVQEFLASELALCRMFQQVNWTIMQNLDFDTDFLRG